MLRTTTLLLITFMLGAFPAHAHTLTTPRMVHVRVLPDRVEVAVAWLIHAGPRAQHLRGRFDRDGDGKLSEEEQDLIANWLQRRVDTALKLTLDGLPLHTEVGALDLTLMRDPAADDEGLQFGSRAAILICPRPGVHELVIEDRPEQASHSVPLRVDVLGSVVGSTVEGEALPLSQAQPGALSGGGFTGKGGKIVVRFDVPVPTSDGPPPADDPPPAPAR